MEGQSRIYIGTSGWNYDHWKETFYPEDLKRERWLDFYARSFRTVEVNNSFYQLPSGETVKQWVRQTPDAFLFAVKASRYITHMKKLKDPRESMKKFIAMTRGFKDKLGPLLFQLPPRWGYNAERLNAFLDALSGKHRVAMEFRDSSWWNDDVLDALAAHNVAFCIYELAGTRSPKEITADFAYLRLHGPGAAYEGKYTKRALAGWLGAFAGWVQKRRDIYCYFDNDQNGYAAANAAELEEMIRGQ